MVDPVRPTRKGRPPRAAFFVRSHILPRTSDHISIISPMLGNTVVPLLETSRSW